MQSKQDINKGKNTKIKVIKNEIKNKVKKKQIMLLFDHFLVTFFFCLHFVSPTNLLSHLVNTVIGLHLHSSKAQGQAYCLDLSVIILLCFYNHSVIGLPKAQGQACCLDFSVIILLCFYNHSLDDQGLLYMIYTKLSSQQKDK